MADYNWIKSQDGSVPGWYDYADFGKRLSKRHQVDL